MKTRALLLPLALTALPFMACSSAKNHEERNAAPEAQGQHPNYGNMSEDELKAACVGSCKPDPGSRAIDQAKSEAGFQFAWLWDLDPAGMDLGVAKSTYTYDDNTSLFVVPKRTISQYASAWGGWEPKSEAVPNAGSGPQWAVRFKGGPFTEYGGGFGQSLRTSTNMDSRNPLLALTPSVEFPGDTTTPQSGAGGAYDLSSWTGLAIWVRRGPDGQSTMRLGITERNSAEDLNSQALADFTDPAPAGVQEGKYCRRWRLCGCSAGTPCTQVAPGEEYRCFDPAVDSVPAPSERTEDFEVKYPVCGVSRCKQANTSTAVADPLFADKACAAATTADGKSDMFCYDPGVDPTPPAKRERCNNPFSRPITVSTDWQLIKVPFGELRQADEANLADDMDLHSVKQFVVTYAGGWTDFWVANIGFYKKL